MAGLLPDLLSVLIEIDASLKLLPSFTAMNDTVHELTQLSDEVCVVPGLSCGVS